MSVLQCGAPTAVTTNGTSRSAPLQNSGCIDGGANGCRANEPKQVLQFSSASEVAQYKRRKVATQYYGNPVNTFPIKNRYGSMYTTFKAAVAQDIPYIASTKCSGELLAKTGNKDSPVFLINKFNPV